MKKNALILGQKTEMFENKTYNANKLEQNKLKISASNTVMLTRQNELKH